MWLPSKHHQRISNNNTYHTFGMHFFFAIYDFECINLSDSSTHDYRCFCVSKVERKSNHSDSNEIGLWFIPIKINIWWFSKKNIHEDIYDIWHVSICKWLIARTMAFKLSLLIPVLTWDHKTCIFFWATLLQYSHLIYHNTILSLLIAHDLDSMVFHNKEELHG